ncbi:MAG: response regulator [Candidatus Cloacimonetes bacterium]|nr:response regulator [Candidatus Cloacimonadota bacterium]MCF7815231.1 response regulator [Candidatus Cloacimonadota bacterium]MCF7869392.1 response regulator [Candidatus Cloacimonadota bacterium]MCF7884792.1 response regulator [Candidatus Cloacimonadota bacterium]
MSELKKIMVVEDNSDMQLMLKDILSDAGFMIDLAKCGEEAICLAERNKYDVVLLDKRLPDIDGFIVFNRIKQLDPKINVVILTAYGDKFIEKSSKQMGAFGYKTKPFVNSELIDIVQQAANH